MYINIYFHSLTKNTCPLTQHLLNVSTVCLLHYVILHCIALHYSLMFVMKTFTQVTDRTHSTKQLCFNIRKYRNWLKPEKKLMCLTKHN